MGQAVLREADVEPKAPYAAQIYAATANASFAEKIALALYAEGVDIVTGYYAQSGAAAVIVVWSGASIGSRRLIAAARSPLAAGAVIPVSIGKVEPPEAFRHIPAVDLAGWAGDPEDPRWRFVVDELRRLALRKERRAEPPAPVLREPPAPPRPTNGAASFEAWFDSAYAEEAERAPSAYGRPSGPPETTVEGRRPDDRAPSRWSRRPVAPLLYAGAASGLALFLGFAALTLLKGGPAKEEAPVASQEPAAPPILASAAPRPVPAPAATPPIAEETPAPPLPAPEAVAPARAAPSADPIAALILENSTPAPRSGPPPSDARFKDCADCPELARIPAGAFRMGPGPGDIVKPGEGPALDAVIEKPFALALTETTRAEWALCVADGACPALPGAGAANGPAVNVSFRDAEVYAAWLSKKTGRRYRLPTEKEWEYAARAGAATPFSFGAKASDGDAAFDAALPYLGSAGRSLQGPKPAASFPANAFGLYDMHGNAWEWTSDCFGEAAPGCARVLKGGAWNSGGWRLRAAHRIGKAETAREYDNGFRLARDL
jgi:formylglycine-generating enzyme required for sulfatase activity